MQSYTDLIVLAIIAGAVLLLMLLLAFFILLHRRISSLEDENEALSSDLDALKLKLSEVHNDAEMMLNKLRQDHDVLSKRLTALDTQISFLQKTQDECIDALDELKDKQSSLKAEQEVQQLMLEKQRDLEHEILQQAKELLSPGVPLEKEQQITAMPGAELEMLKSVQDSRRQRMDEVLADKEQTKEQSAHPDLNADASSHAHAGSAAAAHEPAYGSAMQLTSTEDSGVLSVSSAAQAAFEHIPEVKAEPARPIASWKAREACGMKSLRSRR